MNSALTVALRLVADGKQLVAEVQGSRKEVEDLGRTAKVAAAGVDAASKASADLGRAASTAGSAAKTAAGQIGAIGMAAKSGAAETVQSLDRQTAAVRRLTAALDGTADERLAAQAANFRAVQAERGITEAIDQQTAAYVRNAKAQAEFAAQSQLSQLRRSNDAAARLAAAGGNRAAQQSATIDNAVDDFRARFPGVSDATVAKYRTEQERQYATAARASAIAAQELNVQLAAIGQRVPIIGNLTSRMGTLALGLTAVAAGAILVGKEIVQATVKMESLEARVQGMVGAGELRQTMDYLYRQAQATGSALDATAGSYTRLIALQQGGIITTREARVLLEGFQSAAMALGATSTQVEQSLFGLAQGLSSGTLRAEELNQVVEPLPGLLQQLDKAAGLPAGGFRRLVNEGRVTSEMFRSTLTKALKSYEEAAQSSANTTERAAVRLGNAWTRFMNLPSIRRLLSGVLNLATRTLETFAPEPPTEDEVIANLERRVARPRRGVLPPIATPDEAQGSAARQLELHLMNRTEKERTDRQLQEQAVQQRRARAEQFGQELQDELADIRLEAELTRQINAARARGPAAVAAAQRDAQIRRDTSPQARRAWEKSLPQGEAASDVKWQARVAAVTDRANAEAGSVASDAQSQVTALTAVEGAQRRVAEAAREGGQAQLEAERALKVATFAYQSGGAAAGAYAAALERQDAIDTLRRANETIRGLELETTATERLTAAIGGSAEERLAAEAANFRAQQIDAGITAELDKQTAAYIRNAKARADNAAAAEIDQLRRDNRATANLGAAGGDRAAIRRATVDNAVADFEARNEGAGPDKVAEFRAEQEAKYALAVQESARQTLRAHDATVRYHDALSELNEQQATGILSEEALANRRRQIELDRLDASKDASAGIERALIRQGEQARDMAALTEQATVNAFSQMEDVAVRFAQTGKLSFKGMADSIIADLIRIQMRQAMTGLLGGGSGGGGLLSSVGSWISGLFAPKGLGYGTAGTAAATAMVPTGTGSFVPALRYGAVVEPTGIAAFAKGESFTNRLYDRPTLFRFAKGGAKLGMMGEAGPEAVMPLTRAADGSLGVRATIDMARGPDEVWRPQDSWSPATMAALMASAVAAGSPGAGMAPVTNVIIQPPAGHEAQVEEQPNASGGTDASVVFRRMVEAEAARLRRGTSSLNGAIEGRYGITPKGAG